MQNIYDHLDNTLSLDKSQEKLIEKMHDIEESLSSNNSWLNFFQGKKQPIFGLYIWGSVGTGKTTLSKAWYEALTISKQYIHYQNLMMNIHKMLHNYNSQMNAYNLGIEVAKNIAQESKIIFIDEFEITDITDVYLIYHIFKSLKNDGVFIVLTTNYKPSTIYSGGIHRDRTNSLIDFINNNFEIYNLDSNFDYRNNFISSTNRIMRTDDMESKLTIILNNLNITQLRPFRLDIFGRKLTFTTVQDKILLTSFHEMFVSNLGYSDFVEIGKYFDIVIIKSVSKIANEETDKLVRCINFIDNLYLNKVLLFLFSYHNISEIYQGQKRIKDWNRALSRISEMGSVEYLNKSKYCHYVNSK